MTTAAHDYLPGHGAQERKRLVEQGDILAGFTADVLRRAGLRPGMRVLDVGAGMGDVTLIAAQIVGSGGSVLGIDRDEGAVQAATARCTAAELQNVSFRTTLLEDYSPEARFDAVVGRLFLMHQPMPDQAIRRVRNCACSPGVVAFLETDWEIGGRSYPSVAAYDDCGRWIKQALRQAGVHTDMGSRLYQTFLAAGLPGPEMALAAGIGGGDSFFGWRFYADLVRTLAPHISRFGIATAEEIDLASLEDRMCSTAVEAKAQVITPPIIAAWSVV